MVQTRRTSGGPRVSQPQQLGGDDLQPHFSRNDNPIPPANQSKGQVNNQYNDPSTAVAGSENEITKLRLNNQALQALLKEHLRKSASRNEEEDTAASSTKQPQPSKINKTPEIPQPVLPLAQILVIEWAKVSL